MTDPFETLGIAPSVEIDRSTVERAYLARIAVAHPDRADESTRADPSAINAARRTLLDPAARADALLRRLGGPAAGEHKDLPDGFLMDIMQTRQDLEADLDQAGSDTAALAAVRGRWNAWAESQRSEYLARVADLFRGMRPAEATPPAAHTDRATLNAIRVELNALRYIERMLEQLDPDHETSNERQRTDHAGPAS